MKKFVFVFWIGIVCICFLTLTSSCGKKESAPTVTAPPLPEPQFDFNSALTANHANQWEWPPHPFFSNPSQKITLDDFADTSFWDAHGENNAKTELISANGSLQLNFDFVDGKWLQAKKGFGLSLNPDGVLRFKIKGSGQLNDLQIKLEDINGATFGKTISGVTAISNWKEVGIPLKEFSYFWGGDGNFDWANLRKIYFAVVSSQGGKGSIWVDDLTIEYFDKPLSALQRDFETVKGDSQVMKKAAEWIASMQQSNGLIMSYENDAKPFAWTYDQALCLIVLAHENPAAAKKLLDALKALQKPEGYWNDGILLDNGKINHNWKKEMPDWIESTAPGVKAEFNNRWAGSVSWLIHAIDRYEKITGDRSYHNMLLNGAKWIANEQKPDGSVHNATEGNLDAYWGLKAGGLDVEAKKIQEYLLTKVWNEKEGRFQISTDNRQPYLDCSTWGASFLRKIKENDKALRALSFAAQNLFCYSYDRRIAGFDATGPVTVWNEGTAQYICAGGKDAQKFLAELNKQQRADGALQHSHEEVSAKGAWHTSLYSVCAASWLWFANSGIEPFNYN